MIGQLPALWALHISDMVLTAPVWLGGFVVAALLIYWGSRRVADEEIPRIAVVTAAFFVASLIHVPFGPTKVHLLFNALVGIVLGRRAAIAIGIGLFLQVLLASHGGFTTLGINCCVLALPALAGGLAFRALKRIRWRPSTHCLLVGLSTFLWTLALMYSVTLLLHNSPWRTTPEQLSMQQANAVLLHPLAWLAALAFSLLMVYFERRLRNSYEFALGLLIGEITVLATVALNCAVLILGGVADMTFIALALLVAYLPIAFIEGTILGFTTAFLARVKPEMLGLAQHSPIFSPLQYQAEGGAHGD